MTTNPPAAVNAAAPAPAPTPATAHPGAAPTPANRRPVDRLLAAADNLDTAADIYRAAAITLRGTAPFLHPHRPQTEKATKGLEEASAALLDHARQMLEIAVNAAQALHP